MGIFIPRSETAESYENGIFIFLRNFYTVFYSDCYQFRFCTHNTQGYSFSPHPCQHLLSLVVLSMAILQVRWFQCAFSSWFWRLNIFSSTCWLFPYLFWKKSMQVLCPFLNWKTCFLFYYRCYWIVWVPYIFWCTNPLSDRLSANTFSHSVPCLFILFTVSFCWAEAFSLM